VDFSGATRALPGFSMRYFSVRHHSFIPRQCKDFQSKGRLDIGYNLFDLVGQYPLEHNSYDRIAGV
jgi:hypothetical protein